MLKKVLLGLIGLLAAFSIVVALQPADFKISRSSTMKANPTLIFSMVNDLHRFTEWSPWAKMDPNMQTTFEGPGMGVGSSYAWSGNNDVGEGRMTITESKIGEIVQIRLDFEKPMKVTNMTEFAFAPQGSDTLVTWSMTGKRNFIAKAFCLFLDMDKLVGKDFENGLAQLKTLAESGSK